MYLPLEIYLHLVKAIKDGSKKLCSPFSCQSKACLIAKKAQSLDLVFLD